ncbi:MAG: VCBS repeat-containing protein [Bryobacteraceae bacterium]|nr:VCBS repeat-containing protein [Bryobacteraceae bacterium]MDW8376641.1 VCBS repeat-containing protein [Bryobacterales bacterium]
MRFRNLAVSLLWLPSLLAVTKFRMEEIRKDWGVVYAVSLADMNRDGKLDVVAINNTQVAWFENPTWKRHLVLDGVTKKDNVCFDTYDVDGDGQLDLALGADWQPTNTTSGGTLQWLRHPQKGGGWSVIPLGEEPTLHRLRWGDVDGDGKKELIVVPLHGRGNKAPQWQGQGLRVLVFRIPNNASRDPWPVEVADDSFHIAHNFTVENGEIWVASREGVHALKREANGRWSKRKIGEGEPGEIKTGRVQRVRHLATVEPWHGNRIVIYREPTEPFNPQGTPRPKMDLSRQLWTREVIEEGLNQAHALGWADFDGDGSDELAAGWRGKPWGLALYKLSPSGRWVKTVVDEGVAVEDLAVGDLNGDGKPEIVAGGRATSNIRIYWNESEPLWKRHVIATGYFNFTAIAADFTGDGKVDVISNDLRGKKTWFYQAPKFEPRLIHEGVDVIHSAVIDVDKDGDLDFIGARYSPGLIFWLETPKKPGREAWRYHEIDNHEKGGVNGIHGLLTGDVDRDGTLDLIANSAQPTGAFPNSLAWLRIPAHPRRALQWERYVFARKDAPGLSHYHGFGDVNGDGRPDIASAAKIAPEGNWFAWWEQPPDPRSVWRKHLIATGEEGATNIQMADVNRDGKTDFIATRGHGFGVVWYEAPSWKAHSVNATLAGPHSLAVGDIDGDGDVDAVTCAKDSFIAAWFENDGRGSFTTHHIYEDQAAYDVRLVDMDNDGDLDVLIAGQQSENVVWYENRAVRRPAGSKKH